MLSFLILICNHANHLQPFYPLLIMRKVSSAFLTSACLTWCHPFVRRWLIITVHRNRSHSLQVLTISPSLMTAETLTQRLCYLPLNLSQRLLMPRNLSLIRNWLALSRTRIPSNILIISAWSVFVTRLENSQAAFEEATKTRSHGKLSQTVYNYRELRQNLLDDYTDICNYIDLLARRDKEVDYKPLLAIVNHSCK